MESEGKIVHMYSNIFIDCITKFSAIHELFGHWSCANKIEQLIFQTASMCLLIYFNADP